MPASTPTFISDEHNPPLCTCSRIPLPCSCLPAALVSERVNGYGLIEQLELDYPGIQPLLLGVAALLALAAVWPAR